MRPGYSEGDERGSSVTSVPGFRLGEILYSASDCVVFRAVREQDDLPVVLKVLASEIPTPRELMRYRQEYKILRSIPGSPWILRAHDLLETGDTVALVLEDFGGISLNQGFTSSDRLSVDEVLSVSIGVAAGLGQLHAASVIHKDINPSNILYRRESAQVKIGDLGLASMLTRENPVIGRIEGLEGTLPYISPEQTGRMNRSLDYRTDLYSLGATLYELLVGRTPFSSPSMLELVHCHIAKQPPAPHEVDSRVPRVLSEIAMRLLAKTPEGRYQSAYGVKADLEKCLAQRRRGGPIMSFPIGEQDVSDRLNIPQRLYGRNAELDLLLQGFAEVASQGELRAFVISGRPGIGKTSLVQEVYKPMTEHQASYVSGRFDQLRHDTPYFALIAACQQLIDQMLSQKEEQIGNWREEILAAVSPSAQVLIDFVPAFEQILGPQPAVPALAPGESQFRFFNVMQKLIGVFASKEHPLVLFLDDLQWADAASFKLLSTLLRGAKDQSLFFIGAYRDNEVDKAHPLTLALEELNGEVPIGTVTLSPLEEGAVAQLLADAFHCSLTAALPLSALVKAKTDGNPFFINEFLEFLYASRLLGFDAQEGRWKWDLEAIQNTSSTKNVVDLLTEKIQRLDPLHQQALSSAACLGNLFELDTLAEYLDLTPKATLQRLYPAVNVGLVIPLGDAYQLVEHDAAPQGGLQEASFRFGHDRIRSAAYALLTEQEQEAAHLRMGRLLLRHEQVEADEGRLFEIVNHLNRARRCLVTWGERLELSRLNLRAGKKAKASAAFDLALSSLLCGRELLGDEGWARERELTLELTAEAAEAAFLGTDFARVWTLSEEALAHATTALEKVHPYQVRIWGLLAQNDPVQAIRTALVVLRFLGMSYPENPSKLKVLVTLLRTRALLKRKGIESIAHLPTMQNPSVDAAIRIIRSMSAALFQSNPKLHVLLLCEQLQLMFRHGNNEWSASICGAFGILLCGLLGDLDAGSRVGRVSQALMERYPHAASRCRTMYLYHCFEGHVRDPLQSTLQPLQEGYRIGLDTGDLEYAAFCAHVYCQHAFFSGRELVALEKEISSYTDAIRNLKQSKQLTYNKLFGQAAQNLLGRAADPCRLVGEAFDEEAMLPELATASDGSGVFAVHFHKLALCCVFGRLLEAVQAADRAREAMATTRGMFIFARFHFYDSLVRLLVHGQVTPREKKRFLRIVAQNQKRLRALSDASATNHLHLYHLIEAESLRIRGLVSEAMESYDQAIEQAISSGFINDLALIQELAGLFYLDRGKTRMAQTYLADARVSYLKWGAAAKVEALEREHATLLRRSAPSTSKTNASVKSATWKTATLTAPLSSTSSTTTSEQHGSALDLESVIKATQSISSQIVLGELLDNLIKTAVENAGADKGVLVVNNEGELVVEARYLVSTDQKVRVASVPLSGCEEVSHSIVRFVARTRQIVVLGDASCEGGFVQDPYIRERDPKSVLCIPILRNNLASGVLYLENSQASDAFTPKRVQLLEMLATQAAISLDNAKLYEKLERALVEARESARVKSEFLARTSHELRTPLNAIINIPRGLLLSFSSSKAIACKSCGTRFELEAGEIFDDQQGCPECGQKTLAPEEERFLFQGDHGELRQMLQVSMRSGTHLLAVVNDILDINKLEAGKERLFPQELHVLRSIAQVIESVGAQAAQKHIAIIKPIVEKDILLLADQTKLEQILYNLLGNAIKFSPEGGEIVIDVQTGQGGVLLSVRDQGNGIAPEHQVKIFENFYQVESGSTRKAGGTGLGLAITKRLAELHGGRIWVESELGKGSSFFVELPWKPPAVAPQDSTG